MENQGSTPGVGVQTLTVTENQAGQRIDNFLMARLKGVPKSRIYRIIRKGEVRVNKKRVRPEYKLAPCDAVRVPPIRVAEGTVQAPPSAQLQALLAGAVLYRDADLLILNKPAGLPVHGGTGVKAGLIEVLRQVHPEEEFLELVHRLDKGTSGCLMVARNARSLKCLGEQLRRGDVQKRYHAIVGGHWPARLREVAAALRRQQAHGGERRVRVDAAGKPALTRFRVLRQGPEHSLVEAAPETGRTHQIRVHAQSAGHPIAGDEKYSSEASQRRLRRSGVSRLCLHAASLGLQLPEGRPLRIRAPYPDDFRAALAALGLPADSD